MSLTEGIDTRTPAGRMVFAIMGALAEYERAIIRERVRSGLEAARRRGRIGGRRQVVSSSKSEAILLMKSQGVPVGEICAAIGISKSSYFRHQRRIPSNQGEEKSG